MSPKIAPDTALRRGSLTFRPATLDDAAFEADLETALHPDEPADPKKLRHWVESTDPEWTVERFVLLEDGRAIGSAGRRHAPWEKQPERFGRLWSDFLPEWRTVERLSSASDVMEERGRADGTRIFVTGAREDDALRIAFLSGRGYVEKRRSKAWELDLVRHRDRLLAMAEESRAKMRSQDFRVLTLADDDDPEKYRKLHRTSTEAELDVPTSVPHIPDTFDQFMKWFGNPAVHLDRVWIARADDDVVGISMLSYPPTRGNVWTGWTGTARKIRGKGVARALKLETVVQAIALDIPRVRTENDGENAPILHLNELMGYERIPGWIQFHKEG